MSSNTLATASTSSAGFVLVDNEVTSYVDSQHPVNDSTLVINGKEGKHRLDFATSLFSAMLTRSIERSYRARIPVVC